jgi:hypothetical protein
LDLIIGIVIPHCGTSAALIFALAALLRPSRQLWIARPHYRLMKKFVLVSLVMLATVCFACQSYGQGSLAPLYLFTNGSGSIAPLQNGQLLEVGQSYDMTAIPDSGFVFSSWQPVNVFVSTQISSDPSGGFVTNTSLVSLPVGEYLAPVPLIFIMQPSSCLPGCAEAGSFKPLASIELFVITTQEQKGDI